MSDQMQIKNLSLAECRIKAEDGEAMKFSGYASVFGGVDSYGDTIDPKAYDRTLKGRSRPIRLRWNHYGPVIGKWLKVETDEKGLYVEGELTPGHSTASDVYASLKHGAINGMSIGYYVRDSEDLGDGKTLLKDIELIEISVVEEPADAAALVGDVKSALENCQDFKSIESILRDVGRFSGAEAKAIIASIKTLTRRDAEQEKELKDQLRSVFNKFSASNKE